MTVGLTILAFSKMLMPQFDVFQLFQKLYQKKNADKMPQKSPNCELRLRG